MQQIQLTCSICLSPFQSPTSLFCGHTFCHICIENSLKNNLSCPLCRKPAMPGHQINEMLLQIMDVLESSGLEMLQLEFPQIVICLDCGLTPVNPVSLPCQHLFCYQCTQNNLIEQSCPVCLQPYMITQPIVNQVFNELIQWYYPTIEQLEEKNQKIFGMPIFLFNKQICVQQICQIAIQEDRYKQLIKMATDGSGKFIIVPQTDQFPVYGDMVQIRNIAQFVEIEGCDRLRVDEVYCYVNDVKIPLTAQSYQQFSKQLWLCDFEVIKDVHDKSMIWNQISSFLYACFQELSIDMQSKLKNSFQMMHILKSNQQKQYSESDSLLLLQFLNISKQEFQQLYYDDDELTRNQFIWMKLIGIQKQIKIALGELNQFNDDKFIEQEKPIPINQSQTLNVYLEEEDDQNIENLNQNLVFPNITLSQEIILNIFNLQKMILFQ